MSVHRAIVQPWQWGALGAKYAPHLVSTLLALAIGLQLIASGRALRWIGSDVTHLAMARVVASGDRLAAWQRVAAASLFGARSAEAEPPVVADPMLRVFGVIAASRTGEGMAILGPEAGTGRLYALGAELPGGARLAAVFVNRIVVEQGGEARTIYLERLGHGSPLFAAETQAGATDPSPSDSADPVLRSSSETMVLLNGRVTSRSEVVDGQLLGYRLYAADDATKQAFQQMGLQSGDLLTGINRLPLTDPGSAGPTLEGLTAMSGALLTVQRNGVSENIEVSHLVADSRFVPPSADGQEPGVIREN